VGSLHHLPRYVAADRKQGRVVGAPIRPSKRAELKYRALLFRIVGWCEGVGAQILADLRQHWPVADGFARDAKRPKYPHELAERTRMVARKATEVRNKRGVVRTVAREVDKRLAKSVHAAIGVDISGLLELQSGGQLAVAMEVAAAQNAALIESIPAQYLARVSRAVQVAFGSGQRFEMLAKEIERIGGITERRAKLIARDQTAKMASAFNQIRQVGAGIKSYVWSTSHDERVRPSHNQMNGEVVAWAEPREVDGERVHPGQAVNCFPGDSEIQFAHDVKKAYRRWYGGELAEIVTDSGKTLRATPNHPVLTPLGWLPLGKLCQGDHVIEVADEVGDFVEENRDDRVASIAQVFATTAAGNAAQARQLRVDDFHGDGAEGNVDIVFAARPLFIDHVTAPPEGGHQFGLSKASVRIRAYGVPAQLLFRAAGAAGGLVRRLSEALAFFWRGAFHAEQLGLAYATAGDAGFGKPALYRDALDADPLRDRKLALSGEVRGGDGGGIQVQPIRRRPVTDAAVVGAHAAGAELGRKVVLAEADDLGRFPERLPFAQKASRVVKARRIDGWSGHVYNLETAVGWYVTNGIVTHNCRCVAIPVINVAEQTGGGEEERQAA